MACYWLAIVGGRHISFDPSYIHPMTDKPIGKLYWGYRTAQKQKGKITAETGVIHYVKWFRGKGKPNLSRTGKGWGIFKR